MLQHVPRCLPAALEGKEVQRPARMILKWNDTYKIKITTPQYRLAYHVDDTARLVIILAVSTRDDVHALLAGRSG